MTLQEFKNKYLGKQVEYHSFGSGAMFQCVDSVNQYIVEVLGLTPIIGTNAKDFPTKYNRNEFDWIVNTPDAIIDTGDIPVWNGNVGGGAGHIAICLQKGTLDSFTSLDQNWSQKERVTGETHNYINVIGWLRAKTTNSDTIPVKKSVFEELVRKSSAFDEVIKSLELPEGATQDTVTRSIAATRGLVSSLQKEVAIAQSEVNNQKDKLANISSANMRLLGIKDTEITGLNTRINSLIVQADQYTSSLKIVESNIREEQKSHGITKNELAACHTGNPKINCFNWLLSILKR